MKKYTYLLVLFMITISSSNCQQLELEQQIGTSITYRSEYIDFGEVTNYFVATDWETRYSLINRYNGNNSIFPWIAWNRTNRNYTVRVLDYSPLITDNTGYYNISANSGKAIDTYNYNLNNLPSYTPCIIGYVVAHFRNSDNSILKEVSVKWGASQRIFVWGDFDNIQGKYIDFVKIRNTVSSIPYYGAKENFTSKTTTFRNSKFISKEIVIDPTYNFLGIKPDGTWGEVSFNPEWHDIIGDDNPIILYPGTFLKAVNENYFESPSPSLSQLKKINSEVLISPNPNNGKIFSIKHNEKTLVHKVELYSGLELVYSWLNKNETIYNKKNKGVIVISINKQLNKGLYNCKIYTNLKTFHKKLIVQ